MLNRAWPYQRRNGIKAKEWTWFIRRHHSKSSATAVEIDEKVSHVVGVVEARNDPANGAGLLFVDLVSYNFMLMLENGYYHILHQPYFLGAYLGTCLETLRVVGESTVVKNAWAECCPAALPHPPFEADDKVLEDLRLFCDREASRSPLFELRTQTERGVDLAEQIQRHRNGSAH